MEPIDLFMIWSCIVPGFLVILCYVLVLAIRTLLRRNERLTMLLAVGNAHGGKGTDAARAQVAAVKEMNKQTTWKHADKAAAGIPQKTPRPGLRLKQSTP